MLRFNSNWMAFTWTLLLRYYLSNDALRNDVSACEVYLVMNYNDFIEQTYEKVLCRAG